MYTFPRAQSLSAAGGLGRRPGQLSQIELWTVLRSNTVANEPTAAKSALQPSRFYSEIANRIRYPTLPSSMQ
jgi:hypothetical protein